MPTDGERDRTISRWLEMEAPSRLPDRVLRATFERTRVSRQHVRWQTIAGRSRVTRIASAVVGVAAVAVLAVAGLGTYFGASDGVGGPAGALPTPSPRPDPNGPLEPGTYIAHPLPAPGDTLTVIFDVPEGWEAMSDVGGRGLALVPDGEPTTEPPGGVSIQFLDVTSLNPDPCRWSGTDDDVPVAPSVTGLVESLGAQKAYAISDPVDVSMGGYAGARLDVVAPTEPFTGQGSMASGCDGGRYRLWTTTAQGAGGVYMQGPANRWQVNVLDVSGTRLVIVVADFPGTSTEDRAELDAIVASLAIKP